MATVAAAMVICVASALSIVMVWQRRRTFSALRDVQVIAQSARISFDSVGRHRISWLGERGAETQFRLNTVSAQSLLPTTRVRQFAIGSVQFVKHAKTGLGVAHLPGALMLSGPASEHFRLGSGSGLLAVPSSFHPLWLLAGSAQRISNGQTHLFTPGQVSGDAAIDGLLILSFSHPDELPALERSVLRDLPGLARDVLRTVGVVA